MNLLFIHADKFKYSPKTPSPKSSVSIKDNAIRKQYYVDCLVIFITIDQNDNINKVDLCVKEILGCATTLKCKEIVLMPISHMLPNPMLSRDAYSYFVKIREGVLQNSTFNCYLEPFGYSGNWQISAKGHIKSVLGRWI